MIAAHDMAFYLFLVQGVAMVVTVYSPQSPALLRRALLAQVALIAVFWFVWSGYSRDAWRYLSAFDGNPLSFEEEHLFWLAGHGLSRVFPDPWSLKILTVVGALIFCAALVTFFRGKSHEYPIIGLYVALLVPGFILLFGNTLRQGMAAAMVLLGMNLLFASRYALFALSVIVAFLVHQTALILAAAILMGRYFTVWAKYLLLLAPFVSYLAAYGLSLAGEDLGAIIRYSDRTEGVFHFEKFLVSYLLAWLVVIMGQKGEGPWAWLYAAYVYMVAISACFLKYEVPFERLLLYSDMLLPFVIPALALPWLSSRRAKGIGFAAGMLAGLVLWTHPSVVTALGYAV